MFHPFYESRSLGQALYLEDLRKLNRKDALLLEQELKQAIETMAKREESEWDTAEPEALKKLSVKRKITEQFLQELCKVKASDSFKIDQYHLIFLRQRLANQLGPLATDKVMNESRQDALRQISKEANS